MQPLALQRSRAALINIVPDLLWAKDLAGRYVVVNDAFAFALGLYPVEVEGRTAMDLFPAGLAERFARQDATVITSGLPLSSSEPFTLPDGVERFHETVAAPLRDARGAIVGTIGRSRDVTEQRRLEAQLERARKLEALGLLAGSVAHDFNNLLSVILGGVQLAARELHHGSEAAADLDLVRRAAERAARLTQRLLAFSHQEPRQAGPTSLAAVVRESERLLRRLIPADIVLDVAAGPESCVVRADPSQLEQVVMNLVVNARDAVLAGAGRSADGRPRGVISIEVGPRSFASRDPRRERDEGPPLPPGHYAALLVRDTGIGMDEATRARIFDPFFTTKPVGEGAGIGLAVVLDVVAQHGGTVHVESAPGLGTTFTVLLPLLDSPDERTQSDTSMLPRGTETVLLVENEGAVRETAARILECHGYRVLVARHGGDALLAWKQYRDAIAVVLTDVRMPVLNGPGLARRLRAERPDLPFVFMSGYASGIDEIESLSIEGAIFIPKPVTSAALLAQVRAALDRHDG